MALGTFDLHSFDKSVGLVSITFLLPFMGSKVSGRTADKAAAKMVSSVLLNPLAPFGFKALVEASGFEVKITLLELLPSVLGHGRSQREKALNNMQAADLGDTRYKSKFGRAVCEAKVLKPPFGNMRCFEELFVVLVDKHLNDSSDMVLESCQVLLDCVILLCASGVRKFDSAKQLEKKKQLKPSNACFRLLCRNNDKAAQERIYIYIYIYLCWESLEKLAGQWSKGYK